MKPALRYQADPDTTEPDPLPQAALAVKASPETASPSSASTLPAPGQSLFIKNVGQFGRAVRFSVTGTSCEVVKDSLQFQVPRRQRPHAGQRPLNLQTASLADLKPPSPAGIVSLRLLGLGRKARFVPVRRVATRFHYYLGKTPARWHTDVPAWQGLDFRPPTAGPAVTVRGTSAGLELGTLGRPTQVSAIRFRIEGADSVRLVGADGQPAGPENASHLCLQVRGGTVLAPLLRRPDGVAGGPAISRVGAKAFEVKCPFAAATEGSSAQRTAYAPIEAWYSTDPDGWYLDVASDGDGNTYTYGSASLPARGVVSVVSKFNPGHALLYHVVIGGLAPTTEGTHGRAIAVDRDKNTYLTGVTTAPDLPVTPDAYDRWLGGRTSSAYLAKLDERGRLTYLSYLGGKDGRTVANDIALHASGAACLVGNTSARQFPVTRDAHQPNLAGPRNAFVAVLFADARGLRYATHLGGSRDDCGLGIAVEGEWLCVTGQATSRDFRTTANAFKTSFTAIRPWDTRGSSDIIAEGPAHAFVTVLQPGRREPVYSTFLGGKGPAEGWRILAAGGVLYVAGAGGQGFPIVNQFAGFSGGALNTVDAFVARLNPSAIGRASLEYSTLLGGASEECAYGLAPGIRAGEVVVAGYTRSDGYPVTTAAFQPRMAGSYCVFVSGVDTDRRGPASLTFSSFYGGGASGVPGASPFQFGNGIAGTANNDLIVIGDTNTSDLPSVRNPYPAGARAGYLLRLRPVR